MPRQFKVPRVTFGGWDNFVLSNFLNGNVKTYWLPGQQPSDASDQYVPPTNDTLFPYDLTFLRTPRIARVIYGDLGSGGGLPDWTGIVSAILDPTLGPNQRNWYWYTRRSVGGGGGGLGSGAPADVPPPVLLDSDVIDVFFSATAPNDTNPMGVVAMIPQLQDGTFLYAGEVDVAYFPVPSSIYPTDSSSTGFSAADPTAVWPHSLPSPNQFSNSMVSACMGMFRGDVASYGIYATVTSSSGPPPTSPIGPLAHSWKTAIDSLPRSF